MFNEIRKVCLAWEKVYEKCTHLQKVCHSLFMAVNSFVRLLVCFVLLLRFFFHHRAILSVVFCERERVRMPWRAYSRKCSWSVFPSRMGFCLPIFISTHKCCCDNNILFHSFAPFLALAHDVSHLLSTYPLGVYFSYSIPFHWRRKKSSMAAVEMFI